MYRKNFVNIVFVLILLALCVGVPGDPVQASQAPSPTLQLDGVRIGIQAGHGNGDSGALSCDRTVREADITKAVANQAAALLRRQGAQVDVFIGEDNRLNKYQADAFVALHTDYCPKPEEPDTPSGYKVARLGGERGTGLNGSGDASDKLVQALWDEFGRATGLPQDRSAGHFTPGMLGYYALKQIDASTPGAIIEMGWLSGDVDVLVNHQDKLALGIANSLRNFLGGEAVGSGESATVLVLDISGSMEEEWRGGIKIESAKRAALDVINMIEQESQIGELDHQVAVATFTDFATLELNLTTDYATARQIINNLQPSDRTNIGDGLVVANQALASATEDMQKIIILLSDGLTNEGLAPEAILSGPVQQAAEAGTCIYTVGFGESQALDEALLRDIASGSGCGEYHYASAPSALAQVYVRLRHQSLGTILEEFEGQIAQDETLDVGQVTVPENRGELYITLQWPGSDLDLIAQDPFGNEVTDDYPKANLVKYERLAYLIIEDPLPGPWLLRAYGVDVPEGLLTYHAIASVREGMKPPSSDSPDYSMVIIGIGVIALFIFVAFVFMQSRRTAPAGGRPSPGGVSLSPMRRGQLVIGRDPRCEVTVNDPHVSAKHAVIQRTPQGYVLTDQGSINGTYINGQKVQQARLQGGEQIRVGGVTLQFNADGTVVPAASPHAQTAPAPGASPAQAVAYLAIMVGAQEFSRNPIAPGTVLGRYAGCPVDLSADALVSRQHARLDYQDGQWTITDMDSKTGTLVNGQPVRQQALQHGDELRVGNTRLRFYEQ
jgi:pSer/pThr/pTyr-binding forkhead associated (FHA) protein/Mg-chelatase subunit ChlD